VKVRVKDVTGRSGIAERAAETDNEDLFEMANLYPDTTGLPMTVWISPRGNARHDVRFKVNMTHDNQMSIANTAVVGVRPTRRVISGQLSPVMRRLCFAGLRSTLVRLSPIGRDASTRRAQSRR
jgi:hypothetical protein